MFYYEMNGNILISMEEYPKLNKIEEGRAQQEKGIIYLLNRIHPSKSRRTFCVSDPSLAFIEDEGLHLMKKPENYSNGLPDWLTKKIESRNVASLNTCYPNWQEALEYSLPSKCRVHIAGLGDVGGILASGLRLLGGNVISHIGLYDLDKNKIKRWVLECSQIFSPFDYKCYPEVYGLSEYDLFNCHVFVFCVSAGVPPLNQSSVDVRMAQFENNLRIIRNYAQMARASKFKGIFAVISDPVDHLCMAALRESNINDVGEVDFMGLAPEQIRGYGLGVMNGRALYYSSQREETLHYWNEGRVFGPHGQGLVVADSIENYNEDLSLYLTDKTINANMEVRATGYKPYIAPALSSGSLSIIATLEGTWHYSSTYMGGVFMGAKNRLNKSGVEIERLDIPQPLWNRLQNTYESLGKAYE